MPPYSFHPYPIMNVVSALAFLVVVGGIIVFLQDALGGLFLPLLAVVALYAAVRIAYAYAVAKTYTVRLDENEILYTFGIWRKNEYLLPYNKITEARFSQSMTEQIFGIGTLSVDTPGYTDLPMRVYGVRMADIQKTLDVINTKGASGVRVNTDAGNRDGK